MSANTPSPSRQSSEDQKNISSANDAADVDNLPQALVAKTAAQLRPYLRQQDQAPEAALAVLLSAQENFSGPLPHPKHYERYDLVLPGSADRILAMAEREQKHRHLQQNLASIYPYLGMTTGFLLAFGCVVLGFMLAMNGNLPGAALLVGVPVLGMVGWFIKSRIDPTEQRAASTQVAKRGPGGGKRSRR